MRRRHSYSYIIVATILAVIFAATAVTLTRLNDRADTIEDARVSIANYASIISEQVSNAVVSIEISMQDLIDHHIDQTSVERFRAEAGTRTFYDRIVDKRTDLQRVDLIVVTDANGDVIASTRGFPHPTRQMGDREAFNHLRNNRDSAMFISKPVRRIVSDEWNVIFARRLETAEGVFLGVIVFAVKPEMLLRTETPLTTIAGQTYGVFRSDGVVLTRDRGGVDRTGMMLPKQSQWYVAVAKGGGVFHERGAYDGGPRYVAVQPLSRFALVVTATIEESVLLSKWTLRTKFVAALTFAFFVLLAILARALARKYREFDESNARIEYMAMRDALTGVANRTRFLRHLEDTINQRTTPDETMALLLLDLDGFKRVNDTFGHDIGDELLRQVAARLTIAAPSDFVARLGGDEFALLHVCGREAPEEARDLAERLMTEIRRPFDIEHRRVTVGLSVGFKLVDKAMSNVKQIMRRADLALYAAKRDGRNRCCAFVEEMETEFQAKSAMAEELRSVMSAGGLELHYQPIVTAATGEVVAMEALLRWPHAIRGMISPAVFVPLAEEVGLINALGEWVLSRACADAVAWPESVRLCVNASPIQIGHDDFPDVVKRALTTSGLPPQRLEIEITESVLLHHNERNIGMLHLLHDLGVTIALDDFGTGYSSLSYLKLFPFDNIKIDKSFVDDVTTHAGCAAIICATTMLAHSFEIVTTAEGVETSEQFEALRAAGVSLMQGYYFGRPAPKAEWRIESGRIVLPGQRNQDARAA